MNLAAITGKARAGKDTLAQAFIAQGYRRIAFADALKEVTALIAGEPSHLYFDEVTKEEFTSALGMTRRQALQKVGSAIRNSVGDMTWVNRALRAWEASGKAPCVITDCRYDNEAQAIRNLGGIIIKVVRPDNVGLTGAAASHESEKGVSDDLVDIELLNDGTVGELHAEARKILEAYTAIKEDVGTGALALSCADHYDPQPHGLGRLL